MPSCTVACPGGCAAPSLRSAFTMLCNAASHSLDLCSLKTTQCICLFAFERSTANLKKKKKAVFVLVFENFIAAVNKQATKRVK